MTATPPPVLDGRDAPAILRDLLAARPGYLPEILTGAAPGAGAGRTLLQILARLSELVVQGLDQAPARELLAFLDTAGISLLPPQAARAPIVVTLTPDAPVDPTLPADSEVVAPLPPAPPSPVQPAPGPAAAAPPTEVPFGTEQTITLVRAQLACLQSVVPAQDAWADHTASLSSGFTLFDGLQGITHHLYLGHDKLFDLPKTATVVLDVEVDPKVRALAQTLEDARGRTAHAAEVTLQWQYYTSDGWLAFDPVVDTTRGLTLSGAVILRKLCGPATASTTVGGVTSHWVRAVVTGGLPSAASPSEPLLLTRLVTVRAGVRHAVQSLAVDAASCDGASLDTTKDFLPLGAQPGQGTTFLLACDDAFAIENARIALEFAISTGRAPAAQAGLALAWEYSTADGWGDLQAHNLVDDSAQLTTAPAPLDGRAVAAAVWFDRPDAWAKVAVAGEQHYWLRVRVTAGSYGGPPDYTVNTTTGKLTVSNLPQPPSFAALSVAYSVQTPPLPLDACLTQNGFDVEDHTDDCRWEQDTFTPFHPIDDALPAVHFGFDKPLPVGLVSMLATVPEQSDDSGDAVPELAWEYRTTGGWAELEVVDESDGFRGSGTVQFVGPPDMVPAPGPAAPLWWVRARRKEPGLPQLRAVNALYLNAVWATQRRAVDAEVLGRSDGTARQVLAVQHPPVLEQQAIEVQEWRGTGLEWKSLFDDVPPDAVRYDRDARNKVTAVWVRWQERPHLFSSGPHDRHYTIERTTGLLRFGDGVAGMIPPPGCAVAAWYRYGGGPEGNVAVGAITRLNGAVPYVRGLSNPIAAAGGAAAEAPASVRLRGPMHLHSLDRAITPADYEWLSLEASPEVARARCLLETGPAGTCQPGWVTVVVVPWGLQPQPRPSAELVRRVRAHLAARCPAPIAAQIMVTAADFVPVAVVAELVPADPGAAALVEQRVRRGLDAFLHPLTGGPDGTGWQFGQTVHVSQVARAISSVPGVDHLLRVELRCDGAVEVEAAPIGVDQLVSSDRHLLTLRSA